MSAFLQCSQFILVPTLNSFFAGLPLNIFFDFLNSLILLKHVYLLTFARALVYNLNPNDQLYYYIFLIFVYVTVTPNAYIR